MLICHSYIFLDEVSIQISYPFFPGLFSRLILRLVLRLIFILYNQVSYWIKIYQYFLPVFGLIFIFLPVSKQKVLILTKSDASSFSLMYHAFDFIFKKSFPNPKSQAFSLIVSTRRFILLCFTITSMIHLELIFAYSLKL